MHTLTPAEKTPECSSSCALSRGRRAALWIRLPSWSFFLNKPVHNNWELGRADNYFFFWDKISPAALVAKNGRGEVPDDLQYLRESHTRRVRDGSRAREHVGALLPPFLRSALVRDTSRRNGPALSHVTHTKTGSAFSWSRWELGCARTMPCKAWNQLRCYQKELWGVTCSKSFTSIGDAQHLLMAGRWT